MRAQKFLCRFPLLIGIIGEIEGIMHFSRGVTGREIERGKIMPVIFNVWPFGNFKAHGGKIEAANRPGGGAQFRIFWPLSNHPTPLTVPRGQNA